MTLPTSIQPCASGRHAAHVVTLLDELTARCAPACEAYRWGRLCHHVRDARAKAVRPEAAPPVAGSKPLDLDREFAALEMEAVYADLR